jgi:TIR domain
VSQDIFVSYARKDDQKVGEVPLSKGFVTALLELLTTNLEDLGPPRPRLFRDTQQIGKSDQFEPRLGAALAAAKLLVVVLSRNWLESEWCVRELQTFVDYRQRQQMPDPRIKERILLVVKHVIRPDQRPPWLQGQDGFQLVGVDPENDSEIDYYDSASAEALSPKWFTNLRQLAKELRRKLATMDAAVPEAEPVAPGPGPGPVPPRDGRTTVYLAQPAADMARSYDTLLDELTRRKIRVVPDPDQRIPTDGARAVQMIDAALAEARLSIHLVGDKVGFQPEDAAPIVRLQLDRAARVAAGQAGGSGRDHFHRLIWAPCVVPGAAPDSAARDPFASLAKHYGGEAVRAPADKVDGDTLAKFTQFALQHLEQVALPPAAAAQRVGEGSPIYVQHGEEDTAEAESVAESLKRLGYAPMLPILSGQPADRESVHRDALKSADAVILCWARASPFWVRSRATELRRWEDLGRKQAFKVRAVVTLPPDAPDKERVRRFPPPGDLDATVNATDARALEPGQLDALFQALLVPAS